MADTSARQRARYRFDNFIARGGGSIFLTLLVVFVATLLLLTLLRAVVASISPQPTESGWLWNSFLTFLQMTEPGAMAIEAEVGWWHRAVAVVSGAGGLVLVAALIAFITTAVDRRLHELRKGRSRVMEDNHTLILGWEEQRVVEIVGELIVANESVAHRAVVILAEQDKEYMDDFLAMMLPDTRTTTVVTRSGSPSSTHDLGLAAVDRAATAIVLASCPEMAPAHAREQSDARAVKTLLALRSRSGVTHDLPVVVEVFDSNIRQLVAEIGGDHMIAFDSHDVLSRVLVQTSRSPGLSVVYDEMLSFEGNEIYFSDDPVAGLTFTETLLRYPQAVPVGVQDPNGHVIINPDHGRVMGASDRLLLLAEDDSTITFSRSAVAAGSDREPTRARLPRSQEHYLIVGHTPRLPIVLDELAKYLLPGSRVDIMPCRNQSLDRITLENLRAQVDGLSLSHMDLTPLSPSTWRQVDPLSYNSIVLLSDCDPSKSLDQSDSETILTLMLIRQVLGTDGESGPTIVTELLDSANQPLATSTGMYDFVISSKLVSMLLAQISEEHQMYEVYRRLLDEEGSEVYLKPISLYLADLPTEVAFADLVQIASKRSEIALGLKIAAEEPQPDLNFGIRLAPPKTDRFVVEPQDRLVVLAEDDT